MPEPTILFWSNGFYYAYSRDKDGAIQKQPEPIKAGDLEVLTETPLKVTIESMGNVREVLMIKAYKALEEEALKYARLNSHEGFVTLDDHRRPGEDTIKAKQVQPWEYEVRGRVLLLRKAA